MKLAEWVAAAVMVWMSAACTKVNPERCCINAEDCARFGIEGDTLPCPAGQACVANECVVASCSTQGCAVEAPVCNVESDVCEGCSADADCSRFPDQNVCDSASGGCVECVSPADCSGASPICDANQCRGCELDSECASGACGDDGACVAEASVVYVAPGGSDAGDCPRMTPCKSLGFAFGRTSETRRHIVLAQGTYETSSAQFVVTPATTPASSLVLHGHEATLSDDSAEPYLFIGRPTTIRDVNFALPFAPAIRTVAPLSLERVTFRAATAVQAGAQVDAREIQIDATFVGFELALGANLRLDRAVVRGGDSAITGPAQSGNTVEVTNLLAYGQRLRALDLPFAAGTLAFSTIADAGALTTTGPRSVMCNGDLVIRSSIIWDERADSQRPAVAVQCALQSTIIGPAAAPGATNTDPLFVDPANDDYHLRPNSPARDAVDVGPPFDFEGTPRPQGTRYDLGADEVI